MRRLLSCVVRWRGGDFVTFAGLSFVVGVTDVYAWMTSSSVTNKHRRTSFIKKSQTQMRPRLTHKRLPSFVPSSVASQWFW